jgi:hypothetical protein
MMAKASGFWIGDGTLLMGRAPSTPSAEAGNMAQCSSTIDRSRLTARTT